MNELDMRSLEPSLMHGFGHLFQRMVYYDHMKRDISCLVSTRIAVISQNCTILYSNVLTVVLSQTSLKILNKTSPLLL